MAAVKAILGWRGTSAGPPRVVEPLDAEGEGRLRGELEAMDFEIG